MKSITWKNLIACTAALLVIVTFSLPVMADTHQEKGVPSPLSVEEELQTWGVANPDRTLVAPQKEWPDIPSLTHPDVSVSVAIQETESARSLSIYRAGIKTSPAETWAGYKVTINGNAIANDDPDEKNVYLTPHLVLKDGSDYLAVVLKKTATQGVLELWTLHYGSLLKWNYHTIISQTSYYDFLTIIRPDMDFQIFYRSYPSGSWTQLRSGRMSSQAASVEFFLEHQVPAGDSVTEHGYSYWKLMTLYDNDEEGSWWTQTPSAVGPNYPLDRYSWLVSGYDRNMRTWSEY